ncbi:MAG TPA: septal ring lytic transglycosylase RlpA family protein [Pseudolabrys sp.]|nr:septal ring lytic transglycosylase RlpA family protein [Pseudolabrys sp.]
MQRRAVSARALAYAGAIAGSVLAFSGARAAGETDRIAAGRAGSVPFVVASLSAPSVEANGETVPAGRSTTAADARPRVRMMIIGDASFYEEKGKTSSGERYDPKAFTAAAQILLRDQFGGIYYGKNYRPSYGVAEWGGKKAIIKFNDVGPLAPGRAFDFSRAAMEYFDGIEQGVLPHVTVTLLPLGRDYAQGPVTDTQLAALEAEIDAETPAPQALFVTASAVGAGCGSTVASLQPISLDAIQARLVRTASLDFVAPAGVEREAQLSASAALANDLGATAPANELP